VYGTLYKQAKISDKTRKLYQYVIDKWPGTGVLRSQRELTFIELDSGKNAMEKQKTVIPNQIGGE
jgi:hypothetical protein